MTNTEEKPMSVVSLEVRNLMRLKAIRIVPEGSVVTLAGGNGEGKSSVLNAICIALGGSDFVPEMPIRTGATKADIILDLGEIVAEVKFSASGKSMSLKTKEGIPLKKPQEILDSFWSKMCDPVRFIRLSETAEGRRKQAEILRQLVNLDFSKLNAEKDIAFNERSGVNRDIERTKGKLTGYPAETEVPDKEVVVSELMAELEVVQKHNCLIDDFEKEMDRKKESIKSLSSVRSDLQIVITELEESLAFKKAEAQKLSNVILEATAVLDNEKLDFIGMVKSEENPVRQRITTADAQNDKFRRNARRNALQSELEAFQKQAEELTRKVDGAQSEKDRLLSEAKFPLPGLSFDEGGVFYERLPFSQASQAKQIKVATAIGLALRPRIRVVIIRDASLLDDQTMAEIRQLATDQNAQIWLETVASDDQKAIVIEDGSVAE